MQKTTHNHMQSMGIPSDIDVRAMEDFVLAASTETAMQQQAKDLTAAVNAANINLGAVYRLWREDSTWTHATGFLAGRYAPAAADDKVGVGEPPHTDPDLEAHRMATMAIVVSASCILTDQGIPGELASAPAVAFYRTR